MDLTSLYYIINNYTIHVRPKYFAVSIGQRGLCEIGRPVKIQIFRKNLIKVNLTFDAIPDLRYYIFHLTNDDNYFYLDVYRGEKLILGKTTIMQDIPKSKVLNAFDILNGILNHPEVKNIVMINMDHKKIQKTYIRKDENI